MEAFSSKDIALRAEKKILSKVANKTSVQMFIDETTSEIMDELYIISKEYTGNKAEAQKVIKNLIKIAVKIGVLFRNNRFSKEELGTVQDFKKKLHQGAMTAISFYEVCGHGDSIEPVMELEILWSVTQFFNQELPYGQHRLVCFI